MSVRSARQRQVGIRKRLKVGQRGPRGNPVAARLVKEDDVMIALGTRVGVN